MLCDNAPVMVTVKRTQATQQKSRGLSDMKKSATATIGACGEHYVAAYLSGQQLIVAMPRAGVPGFDMLVSTEKGGHAIRVQVKTGTQATRKTKDEGDIYLWSTSYSAIDRDDKFLWYAYVWLNDWPSKEKLPEIFFVPSKVVVDCMKECKDNNESWPYFWMRVGEASKYKGDSGLQLLLNALGM